LYVENCLEPGSAVHTDGWQGYVGLHKRGYQHEVTMLRGRRKDASKLLPRVHLAYYLDEFTFRFNRRNSKSRRKLFCRLVQQAVATGPTPYPAMVREASKRMRSKPQSVGAT
jgi:transposase-like protein